MEYESEISICTGLMLNDHSNPYIERTTVLSDIMTLLPTGLGIEHYQACEAC